jgi:type IX secretion system PorP/SprF family membrane protein
MKKYLNKGCKFLLLSICFNSFLMAQDIHFAMPEFSPLTLNPALAGAHATLHASANYRNQWGSIFSPYQTIAASIDGRVNEKKANKKGFLAAGMNFSNDKAGDLRIFTSTVSLNAAYHLKIGNLSKLGVGIYGLFGQRGMNRSAAQLPNQYDGMAYNASIGGESFSNYLFSYFSVGAGMVYSFDKIGGYMRQRVTKRFDIGLSAYHLNQPMYSYINLANEKLNMRFSAFFNSAFAIKNTDGILMPAVYVHRQASSMEILFGSNYRYSLNDGSKKTSFYKPIAIYGGVFHRFADAIILKAMFEYKDLMVGCAYEYNMSKLRSATKSFGGFELFLRYNVVGGFGQRKLN